MADDRGNSSRYENGFVILFASFKKVALGSTAVFFGHARPVTLPRALVSIRVSLSVSHSDGPSLADRRAPHNTLLPPPDREQFPCRWRVTRLVVTGRGRNPRPGPCTHTTTAMIIIIRSRRPAYVHPSSIDLGGPRGGGNGVHEKLVVTSGPTKIILTARRRPLRKCTRLMGEKKINSKSFSILAQII